MDKVRYYIKWDGKDKRGIVKGELEISPKIGETVLAHAVVMKIGTHVLEVCKNGRTSNKKTNRNKTKNRKRNN
jgi:hypothetical protein